MRVTCNSVSSFRTCWLTAGWVQCNTDAAVLKLRYSATTARARRSSNVNRLILAIAMIRLNNPGLTFVRTERNISSVAAYRPTDQRCEAGRRPDIWDDAVGCLSKLGAGHVHHPGGSLLAHLIRTGDVLLD